jgi:hypothetical protein
MNERCDKCKFWRRIGDECEIDKNLHEDDRSGICQRYPPTLDSTWPTEAAEAAEDGAIDVGISYLDYRHWNQPVTEARSFCGEFRKEKASK